LYIDWDMKIKTASYLNKRGWMNVFHTASNNMMYTFTLNSTSTCCILIFHLLESAYDTSSKLISYLFCNLHSIWTTVLKVFLIFLLFVCFLFNGIMDLRFSTLWFHYTYSSVLVALHFGWWLSKMFHCLFKSLQIHRPLQSV